jgi:catalase
MQPPASWAQCEYNGLHAFRWIDADGATRGVRWRFAPEAGEATLDPEEAKKLGPDYLSDDIRSRLDGGTVAFRMIVQLAEEGDPLDDPTAAWPEDRDQVEVGRLELTGLDTTRERDGDVLVFDPTRVPDGIELTEDRILRFRPHAYAVSVERRAGVPSPY